MGYWILASLLAAAPVRAQVRTAPSAAAPSAPALVLPPGLEPGSAAVLAPEPAFSLSGPNPAAALAPWPGTAEVPLPMAAPAAAATPVQFSLLAPAIAPSGAQSVAAHEPRAWTAQAPAPAGLTAPESEPEGASAAGILTRFAVTLTAAPETALAGAFDGRVARDPALVGPLRAEAVLGPLRRSALAALTAKADGPVTEARVFTWIRGLQGLSLVPILSWLGSSGGLSPAGFDREAFLLALARLNARLPEWGVPEIDLKGVDILADADGEVEPGLRAAELGHRDLRELGALHESGRIQVYGGLAAILGPERLAAVILHEHLAKMGFDHRTEVVPAMQKIAEEAFGQKIIHADLEIMARRALRGPHEDHPRPPARRPEPPSGLGREPATGFWSKTSDAVGWTLAGLWGLFLAWLVFSPGTGRNFPWNPFFLLLGLTAASVAVLALGWVAGRGGILPFRDGRIGPVAIPFEPRSLELRDLDSVDGEDGPIPYMIFSDRRGWLVALIPHAEDVPGGDRVLEVQWARRTLAQDNSSRVLFIFSSTEFLDHPDYRGRAVPVNLFRARLLGHFKRAAEEFLRGKTATDQDRRRVSGFLSEFERALDRKGDDDQPAMAD